MSEVITYEKRTIWDVYLEGAHIGQIRVSTSKTARTLQHFQYFPNKQKHGGEIFYTLQDCKDNLE